ncbi:hypothetical protein FN976_27130 [Caenimonas sedimenti]|uniref:Glutamate--cysteine ligase n=1 Tax=Caenimonas sedimenti TaxID=2596921 RepID=A0A562ZF34_9BURK|nr:hypothetical protein [Caenimonas sedimenti]TWO66055.1 hypothetical protein FN976_27130 [Caenimonas sedimenti]
MENGKKLEQATGPGRLRLAAMGLEAECSLMLDDQPTRPEDLFGSPRDFIRGDLMHRQGTSYHLPTGGAVYFDTGVIEVATPVVEIERGCAARAGRSLWEALQFIRGELDDWDARNGHVTRLVGFSAHYNVSFELPAGEPANGRTIEQLALLLTYVLPVPVMLLATNRRSTGVGVRPRGDRIEITSDFTPNPSLMIATAALIAGVVREVMTWPSYGLDQLAAHNIPVISGFEPVPHTSRKGWLARYTCYPRNPFTCDIDSDLWRTQRHGGLSLRALAERIVRRFLRPIRRMCDPFTFRLLGAVLSGRSPSLLDLEDRPAEYEDVGKLCTWDMLAPSAQLARSRYERVVMRAVAGQQLRIDGHRLRPIGMSGWSAIVFRGDDDRREVIAIDDLIAHLDDWER